MVSGLKKQSVKTIDSDLRMIYNGMLFKKIYMHILQLQSENKPKWNTSPVKLLLVIFFQLQYEIQNQQIECM
jgi:hypothetical protein